MKRVLQVVGLIVGIGAVVMAVHAGQHWWAIHLGLVKAGPDPYYNFWSGTGSDLTEITIIGAVIAGLRQINCHTTGCWRLGKHPVTNPDGSLSPFKMCRKHHPHIDETKPITPERAATWRERHPAKKKASTP